MCVWYWLPASGYYGCSSPETASPVTQILASSQSPSLFTVSVNEFAHKGTGDRYMFRNNRS